MGQRSTPIHVVSTGDQQFIVWAHETERGLGIQVVDEDKSTTIHVTQEMFIEMQVAILQSVMEDEAIPLPEGEYLKAKLSHCPRHHKRFAHLPRVIGGERICPEGDTWRVDRDGEWHEMMECPPFNNTPRAGVKNDEC
jgi:hypothetical protein